MTDYKSMYYHLAGRTATAVDVLEATTDMMKATTDMMIANTQAMEANVQALVALKEKLKAAQQVTEEIFMGKDEDVQS